MKQGKRDKAMNQRIKKTKKIKIKIKTQFLSSQLERENLTLITTVEGRD